MNTTPSHSLPLPTRCSSDTASNPASRCQTRSARRHRIGIITGKRHHVVEQALLEVVRHHHEDAILVTEEFASGRQSDARLRPLTPIRGPVTLPAVLVENRNDVGLETQDLP